MFGVFRQHCLDNGLCDDYLYLLAPFRCRVRAAKTVPARLVISNEAVDLIHVLLCCFKEGGRVGVCLVYRGLFVPFCDDFVAKYSAFVDLPKVAFIFFVVFNGDAVERETVLLFV